MPYLSSKQFCFSPVHFPICSQSQLKFGSVTPTLGNCKYFAFHLFFTGLFCLVYFMFLSIQLILKQYKKNDSPTGINQTDRQTERQQCLQSCSRERKTESLIPPSLFLVKKHTALFIKGFTFQTCQTFFVPNQSREEIYFQYQ